MSSAIASLTQLGQTALAALPESVQSVVLSPLLRKAVAVLIALRLLKAANNQLSKSTLNNWTDAGKWNPNEEIVLVTGGSNGIGKQVVEDLAKLNVKVIILDIIEPTFTLPPNVFFYKSDITSTSELKQVADEIRKSHGDPTVLINNAGVAVTGFLLAEPESEIRKTFEVNTLAHFWTIKEFLPSMIQKNHGHIITVASLASFVVLPGIVDYGCTKASALAFHEGLAQELRHVYRADKVRTSIIHPLWVRTQMTKSLQARGKDFKQLILEPQVVSDAIIKQIVTQKSGQIILPSSRMTASLLRALPSWLQEGIRNNAGAMAVKHRKKST